MHRPPAVSWEVAAASWPIRALAGTALVAAALLVAFAVKQGWNTTSLSLLLLLPVTVWVAFRGVRRTPKGSLHWDGERWHWAGENTTTVSALVCALDLQNLVLLQVRVAKGTTLWLWLQKGGHIARWLALRRALALAPYNFTAEAEELPP